MLKLQCSAEEHAHYVLQLKRTVHQIEQDNIKAILRVYIYHKNLASPQSFLLKSSKILRVITIGCWKLHRAKARNGVRRRNAVT